MGLEEIEFGGLAALQADEREPLNAALDATNLLLDRGILEGRNGYRAVMTASLGSGTPQGIFRFRPGGTDRTTSRTIFARGGNVYNIQDPTSEQTVDGANTPTYAGMVPFTDGALLSAAQHGKYLYIASDQASQNWIRVNATFAAETYAPLSPPAVPVVTAAPALAVVLLHSLTQNLTGLTATYPADNTSADWIKLGGAAGGYAEYLLSAAQDWSSDNWLFIACAPETSTGGGNTFKVSVVSGTGTVEDLQTISDTQGDGSPYCAYLSLRGLTPATRSAVAKLRFTQLGPGSDPFCVASYMLVPSAPSPGPVDYYATVSNNTTAGTAPALQESDLSPKLTVTYNSDKVQFPTFHAARWNYNSFQDLGSGYSTNPDSLSPAGLFNKSGGLASPNASEFASLYQFAVMVPAGTPGNTVNLYRLTSVGLRYVKSVVVTANSGTAQTVNLIDDTGDATLSHLSYKAGGSPPACRALASCRGRLVAGGDPANPNRLSISSYAPFAQSGDPFPQYPAISLIPSDGWSFDIAPTSSEQILWLGNGDLALYVLTNEACYVMTSLDPNSTPFKVFERGVLSRRGACWAESSLFWAAHDGIYMARNRSQVEELSRPIRRAYRSWFAPDATTVLAYQDRKLYAIRGSQMLRYDFVTETWTRHTLAHTILHADDWRDPTGTFQQMWFQDSSGYVFRWQPGAAPGDANAATSDAGTAIPAWVYSTGFALKPIYNYGTGYGDVKMRIGSVFLDSTGTVVANIYKDATTSPTRAKTFSAGEHQLAFASDLTAFKFRLTLSAQNGVQVRRALWERQPVAAKGG